LLHCSDADACADPQQEEDQGHFDGHRP
jgi:hypothetical protein